MSKAASQHWLSKILRAVARLCLRRSIQLQQVYELCKAAFVQAAREEFQRKGEKPAVSRISATTGVHRKDVDRLMKEELEPRAQANLYMRVASCWRHDPRFSSKRGRARALSSKGKDSEFAQLCEAVDGRNLSPYTILKEMERIGMLERKKDSVCLLSSFARENADIDESLLILAEDCTDLCQSVEENVFEEKELKNLHITTEYDQIPVDALPEIRQWLLEKGSAFHAELREYLSDFDLDCRGGAADTIPVSRVSLSTFSFCEQKETGK